MCVTHYLQADMCSYVLFCSQGYHEKPQVNQASLNDWSVVGHFWVTFCLSFKTSLCKLNLKWKWLSFVWKWTCRQNTFLYGFRLLFTQRKKATWKWPNCNYILHSQSWVTCTSGQWQPVVTTGNPSLPEEKVHNLVLQEVNEGKLFLTGIVVNGVMIKLYLYYLY